MLLTWIEHVASPLPRECSTTELQEQLICSAKTPNKLKLGAGEGNRTLVISLEGFSSTIELHPHGYHFSRRSIYTYSIYSCLVEGAGFEPAYSERTDLQSVAFNHSATPPREPRIMQKIREHVNSFLTRASVFRIYMLAARWKQDSS